MGTDDPTLELVADLAFAGPRIVVQDRLTSLGDSSVAAADGGVVGVAFQELYLPRQPVGRVDVVGVAPNDELGFQYTFTTKRHVKNPKAPEKNYIETAKGTFNYVVKKARDGTWDFTGWENDYKYKAKEVTE